MRIVRHAAFTGVAISGLLLLAGSICAASIPRVELLRQASIAGTRVLLSDLLPTGAPESLRLRAAEISLGAAPQPGNLRILAKDLVERDAGASEGMLLEISIPESIVIS